MADVVAETPDLIREEDAAERLSELLARARVEVAKAVVGYDEAVDLMLIAALARGHVLLEGPPGHGEDAARAGDGARARRELPARPVHARTRPRTS